MIILSIVSKFLILIRSYVIAYYCCPKYVFLIIVQWPSPENMHDHVQEKINAEPILLADLNLLIEQLESTKSIFSSS